MNLTSVICVRMSSTRLPGKALCVYDEQSGKTNLECLIERVKTSRHSPEIIIATSEDKSDDPIHDVVGKLNGVILYRGSLDDVVGRFDEAVHLVHKNPDYIWRVMADCPLVDVGIVDWRLDVLQRTKADFTSIIPPEPTYAAQGSVWSREAWDYCAKYSSGSQREHPGCFLYENLGQFRTVPEIGPESIYYQPVRTELDTLEDLEFFKAVWKKWNEWESIDKGDVIDTKWALHHTSKDMIALNSHIREKTHSSHLHGHHRARNVKCKNCEGTVAIKVNDGFEIKCQSCGEPRRIYL